MSLVAISIPLRNPAASGLRARQTFSLQCYRCPPSLPRAAKSGSSSRRYLSTTSESQQETHPSSSTSSSEHRTPPLTSSSGAAYTGGRFVQTPSFPPPSFPRAFGANQVVPLDAELQDRLNKVTRVFPQPLRFAFAYGSGVFPQSQAGPEHTKKPVSKSGKKMIDLVIAVTHPPHWHGMNMTENSRHYSLISKVFGSIAVNFVQKLGAGMWYNPYVKLDDEMVKYGVISIDTLCKDLLDWDTLYVSGRMHKPVAMLETDARVRLAQQVNLTSALRTALLLLPEHFTEVELYSRIASISYTGDFRMSVPGGENADKVRNIVLAQRDMFRRLYAGLIRSLGTLHVEETRHNRFTMTQERSAETRAGHAKRLPLRLREKLQQHYTSRPDQDNAFMTLSLSKQSDNITRKPGAKAAHIDASKADDFWLAVVQQADFEKILLEKIAEIVRAPAWTQSLKGIYTAGFSRSLRYVLGKVGKYFEGRRERAEKEKMS